MREFYIQLFCEINSVYSIIIEDDGRVAYIYLMEGRDIIGDVWLYNQAETPEFVNWDDVNGMPFLNPIEYVKENIQPIIDESELEVHWTLIDGILEDVYISVCKKRIVKLSPGATPGWSVNVIKNGPLAKVWNAH